MCLNKSTIYSEQRINMSRASHSGFAHTITAYGTYPKLGSQQATGLNRKIVWKLG